MLSMCRRVGRLWRAGGSRRARSSRLCEMARLARVIALEVAHHVTQRGNARQFILDSDAERQVYLSLLVESLDRHQAALIGYCLMSNHVHLVMVPQQSDALANALKHTHGRYAAYWNAKRGSGGHVWQGRYYSCPLDQPHLWQGAALHGAQSGAGGAGGRSRGVEMVERGGALWICGGGGMAGNAGLDGAVGCFGLESLSGSRSERIGNGCRSSMHPYRATPGERSVRAGTGGENGATTGSPEGRRPAVTEDERQGDFAF
jgi:REP element-mobilizing transposase RayT